MGFDNIPEDIKKSSRFCFWRSITNTNPTKKAIKKPYGLCKKTSRLVPSLKKMEYWISWKEILSIIQNLSEEWGIGLILNDGPYVVIDLDNCLQRNMDGTLKLIDGIKGILELFHNAYIEVSPSLRGLHIIFRGEWYYKQNKSLRYLDQKSNSGTIEIYSGKDCRFITLTGFILNQNCNRYQELPSGFENEMKFLFFKYFERHFSKNKNYIKEPIEGVFNHLKVPSSSTSNKNLMLFDNTILSIKQQIQNSLHSEKYKLLCNNNLGKYKSISEADWFFCLFVLKFFTSKQAERPEILEEFLLSERPYREKLNRKDYVHRTVCNAIIKAKEDNLIGSLLNYNINMSSLKKAKKDNILRLCNRMYIFHLGRPTNNKSREIVLSQDSQNYLQVSITKSLNSRDCDYYIQILKQSAEKIRKENIKLEDLTNKHLAIDINIQQILENLSLSIGGKTYKDFIDSLDKMASVTIKQHKKINVGGELLQYRGNLLSYLYKKDLKQKKLTVYLNLLTVEILVQGQYNYSLFNLESYGYLDDHRLRFLYYYFCLRTIPGGYPVKFTLNQLLESLWLESNSKETIKQRRRTLINLLESLEKQSRNIRDIQFELIRNARKIEGVCVKKRKMILV